MKLPDRLRDTTLGDLLATFHRAYATGVLELDEPRGRHVVHLRRGLVHAVEASGALWRLGDVLTAYGLCARATVERASQDARARAQRIGHRLVVERAVSVGQRDAALTAQRARRLDALFDLEDATLRFEAPRPLPPGGAEQPPMSARETFHQRARRRDRGHGGGAMAEARAVACAVLGVAPDASSAAVRQRFRERVRALHPDLAPTVSDDERAAREAALRAVLAAYRALAS